MLNKLRTAVALWLLKGTSQGLVVVNINGHPVWFIDVDCVDGSKLPGTVIPVQPRPGTSVIDHVAAFGVAR